MRMVGTVALDGGPLPGASAVALACDLSSVVAQAAESLRGAAGTVVRGVVAVLQAGGPAVAALRTSFRTLSTQVIPAVVAPRGIPHSARRTDAQPPRRSTPRLRPPDTTFRELVLPADATAPGLGRAFLRRVAGEWGVSDDVIEDAAMVITELVANAVDHACSASTLGLRADQGGLCVTVRDDRAVPLPRLAPIDPTAARGRGLQMVDALAGAWGVSLHADGKTVWAVLNGT
jgi:anti-sigma regulatory factor (Ser/Thr protein kinase)